jgi:hypothetical protein
VFYLFHIVHFSSDQSAEAAYHYGTEEMIYLTANQPALSSVDCKHKHGVLLYDYRENKAVLMSNNVQITT